MPFWTDPGFATTLAIASASSVVIAWNGTVLIQPNFVARGLAIAILARECIGRIDPGMADSHPPCVPFVDAAPFTGIDIGAAIASYQDAVANPANQLRLRLSPGSTGKGTGFYAGWGLVPTQAQGTFGVAGPPQPTPAPVPPPTEWVALNAVVLGVQNDRNVAIDAGLAATCAATLTAARATWLAQIQAAYPDRWYT